MQFSNKCFTDAWSAPSPQAMCARRERGKASTEEYLDCPHVLHPLLSPGHLYDRNRHTFACYMWEGYATARTRLAWRVRSAQS